MAGMSRPSTLGHVVFASLAFLAGIAVGYGLHARKVQREDLRPTSQKSEPAAKEVPSDIEFRLARGKRGKSEEDQPIEEEKASSLEEADQNPYMGLPAEELLGMIQEAALSHEFERLQTVLDALGPLQPSQLEKLSGLFFELSHPEAAEILAHALVRHGGEEGLQVVAQLVQDNSLGFDLRIGALEALEAAPPETRSKAAAIAHEILHSEIPRELSYRALHLYGRLLGPEAVPALVGLLDGGSLRTEPILEILHEFAETRDLPLLEQLLDRPLGRDAQGILLSALGKAAGAEGGRLLLDYLENPPRGIRREAIGMALEERVRKEDLPNLWDALRKEEDRHVQAGLARAILHVGGTASLEELGQMAMDPNSALSLDTFAWPLAETASRENIPLMMDLLQHAQEGEASEALAHGIARISGHDGMDKLLDLASENGYPGKRAAMIQAIEDFGDPAQAERLKTMLQVERDRDVSFHLAKAILQLDSSIGPRDLLDQLPNLSQGIQRAAVLQGLIEVERGTVIPLSRQLLREDGSAEVRRLAAQILGESGDPSAVEDLTGALASEADPEVREVIEEILKDRKEIDHERTTR